MRRHRARTVALHPVPLIALLVSAAFAGEDAKPDPSKAEVPLPCAEGWSASLVLDNGATGIWTVRAFQVFPQYACPEVVGLDDMGRCWILVSYSGKWTPLPTIEEKKWLGGLTHGDVDPRAPGDELYTGGQLGNLYQVRAYPHGATDHRLIARFEGREIHTVLSGDLDPRTEGQELLVFTSPGALYRVRPTGPDGGFETELLQELPGRVRDALLLPDTGATPEIATVSRAGEVGLLSMTADGPRWSTIHSSAMGKGRLTLAPARRGAATVLYSSQDDGIILRHERQGRDQWRTEPIYLGPQGTRGVVAGRFDADPDVETIAVFGYSKKVELLSKRGGTWSVETIFVDRDKGHWLGAAELDGRNSTDEIIGSGYGARIFQLARPPGYGLEGVPAAPAPAPPEERDEDTGEADDAPKVALRARREAEPRIDPLSYGGGFQTKTLLYETLVQRDGEGRIVPALADRWRVEDGGRAFVFHLRPGARFHDGAPVDAEAVRVLFRRWVGLPEHAWLGACERIRDVVALAPDELRVELDRAYALLPDLCAINPCSIRAPGALSGDGRYLGPVGSGPFRLIESRDAGRVLALERFDARARGGEGRARLDLVCFAADERDEPLDALRAGRLDLVFDGWYECVPREKREALAQDPDLEVAAFPGSSVWYLSFCLEGATAELDLRRRVQAAVDRAALVREVEAGAADPCRTWAAPALAMWPAAEEQLAWRGTTPSVPLVLVVDAGDERQRALGRALARQLGRARLQVELRELEGEALAGALEHAAFDLRLERTWGSPYDPDLSLRARFLPAPAAPTATERRDFGVDPELRRLVARAGEIAVEAERAPTYAEIQRRIDRAATLVPLYALRRLAVVRRGWPLPELGPDPYRAELGGWLEALARSGS